MGIGDWLSGVCFKAVHKNQLVYNTCWEDPRLDHVALELSRDDRILMLTSAGCNALDYALKGPAKIVCVDMNVRQNALLELKRAALRSLDYSTFFRMFGQGRLENCEEVYRDALRPGLAPAYSKYWDRRIRLFDANRKRGFYFRGTSGAFAKWVNVYIDHVAKVRPEINAILEAETVEEQAEIYDRKLSKLFWKRAIRWMMRRDTTLAMLGVPRPQRIQVEREYPGGIASFIQDSVEAVFRKLPLKDNYFWRVYLTGEYTPSCCPEYLKPANFELLRSGLADCIETRTGSIVDYLETTTERFSRFVLLDHMDWLSTTGHSILAREWHGIFSRSAPKSRVLFRSGGLHVDFVDPLTIEFNGKSQRVGDILQYNRTLASELHAKDRVHTYGSFYIADFSVQP